MSKSRFVIISLILTLFLISLVYAVAPSSFYRDMKDGPVLQKIEDLSKGSASFSVSLFTGAATYNYPIEVPQGTNGLSPNLFISYNHQSPTMPGLIGTGFSLSENYIQRDTNYSRNNVSNDMFILVLDGESNNLRYSSSDARYHTEIESFLNVKNASGGNNTNNLYWTVRTKDGTTYRFGYNNDSEQVSNQENYTTRWYLDLVNDTYDNKIFYSYRENPYSSDSGTTYPYKINYNNDRSREIEFVLDSSDRPDVWQHYDQSNLVKMSRRLKEIQVKANNSLVRKYVLDYSYLDTRSFLNKISLYGNDNTSLLYSDSFSYYAPQKGWTQAGDNWDSPYDFGVFLSPTGLDNGVRFVDVNRDGFTDVIRGYRNSLQSGSESSELRLNNRSGWGSGQSGLPYSFTGTSSYNLGSPCTTGFQYGIDRGIRFADLNGDGFEDFILSPHNQQATIADIDLGLTNTAYFGRSNLSWLENTSFASPTGEGAIVRWNNDGCTVVYGTDQGFRQMDLNGDGLTDISINGINSNTRWSNNGRGWTSTPDWNMSVTGGFVYYNRWISTCTRQFGVDKGVRFGDINGDGLDDMLISREEYNTGTSQYSTIKAVYLNNGRNFTEVSMTIPELFTKDQIYGSPVCETRFGVDPGTRLVDVNGDGFADIVYGSGSTENVYINNGTGWNYDSSWDIPAVFVNSLYEDQGVRLVDVNGDGIVDFLKSIGSTKTTWLSNESKPYYLKQITTHTGGKIDIDYKESTYLSNKGNDTVSDLGFNLWVVANITSNNNISGSQNVVSFTSYNYSDGSYDYSTKDLRGFNLAEEKIDNKTIRHLFHQDVARKGLEYDMNISDSTGNPYGRTQQTWNSTNVSGYFVVNLLEKSEYSYDGSSANPKIKNTSYSYDTFGNTIKIQHKGDVASSVDDKFEYFNFVNNSNSWIVDKVKNYTLLDSSNVTKTKEILYSYDSQAYGQPPTKGSLTSQAEWINTDGSAVTNYTYNSFGNIVNKTSPNGQITQYVFGIRDTTNTFADRIINAKNQIADYSYDLGTGNLLSESDSNGLLANYSYDIFSIEKSKLLQLENSLYPTQEYSYNLTSNPISIVVKQRESNGTSNTIDTYRFYDGFGRLIQIRSEADGSRQIVKDVYYDVLGRIVKESNPYFSAFSTTYVSANSTVKSTNYTYDPLDRVLKVINPDSTSKSFTYNRWNVTLLDEKSNKKEHFMDAYGSILSVVEYNGNSAYRTNYTYNTANELISINDSLGNIFNFTYDSLGRKIKESDPDRGIWNYTYDSEGNLIKQSDNRNISVSIVYDSLNRKLNETSDKFVNYIYDSDLNSTLSDVITNISIVNYSYDNRLRKVQEDANISDKKYYSNWAYDSADRVTSQVMPDGRIINFGYNGQGLLSSISTTLTNVSYSENNNPLNVTYANNLNTDYSYNSSNLRLTRVKTSNKQDLNYVYDAVGNILNINDSVHLVNYAMSYDSLNRLNATTISGSYSVLFGFIYDQIGNLRNVTGTYAADYYYQDPRPHATSKVVFY